jgi:transcriptional regulator with XRE-family HTH domain
MPRGHVLPNSEVLASLRGEAGLTQDELAARAGYGLRTIGKIESGLPTTSFTLAAIATVLSDSLGRRIDFVDLLQTAGGQSHSPHFEGSTFIVGEHIKLLDLPVSLGESRHRSQLDRSAASVLIETLCLRYVPADRTEIQLHYATTGTAIDGRSLSHPDQAEWLGSPTGSATSAGRRPMNVRGLLKIRVPAAAGRQLIQNRVEYVNAFSAPDQQWFHTQVVYPTDSLTLLVRFPADRPYQSLRGLCQRRIAGPLIPPAEQPISISAGRLAYWRIAAPTPGESYQLGWT